MSELLFHRSSYCLTGDCVEVALLPGDHVVLADSKAAGDADRRPTLTFTAAEWDAFVRGVAAGEFDRSRLTESRG